MHYLFTGDAHMGYFESARLDKLHAAAAARRLPDGCLERMARLAAAALRVPAACISLRSLGTAGAGDAMAGTARYADAAALGGGEMLRIDELANEAESADAALAADAGARALMAVPLVTAAGRVLGGLCVVDRQPRVWTDAEAQTLRDVSCSVVAEVELWLERSERVCAEPQRMQREQQFRTVFREAAIGMAILDLECRPIEINPALERMLGYGGSDLEHIAYESLVYPSDYSDLERSLFADLLDGRREFFQLEKRLITKDGALVTAQMTVSLLHDGDGRPCYALGLVEDVTLRQVTEAMREHETRLRALHELAVGVQHEINNVLAVLQGNAELLSGSSNLSAEERANVEAMMVSVRRLAKAICRLDRVEDLPVVPYVGRERMVDLSNQLPA
jgi:PAS domain S-box-containing protein